MDYRALALKNATYIKILMEMDDDIKGELAFNFRTKVYTEEDFIENTKLNEEATKCLTDFVTEETAILNNATDK